MTNKQYIEEALFGWEQNFHKGQLTLWIFLSLKESAKSLEEIIIFIEELTAGVIWFDEQSIYRALRKYYETEWIDFTLHDSPKGPPRKYYQLTPMGQSLLELFVQRNITIFHSAAFKKLLK